MEKQTTQQVVGITTKTNATGLVDLTIDVPISITVPITETDVQHWMDNCADAEALQRLSKYARYCTSCLKSDTDHFRSLA